MAEIYSLVYKASNEEPTTHYYRVRTEQVHLVGGHGIDGDEKAGKQPDRHLNIMSYETLAQLQGEGFKTQPGEMGEQIIVRGLAVGDLLPGARLQLGESAVVVVNKLRTGCDRFEAIQGKPRTDAAGRLGVMATVIASGVVRVGDPVRVIETVAE